jgi:CubicO group peptidase (beta-lactamase class C family)
MPITRRLSIGLLGLLLSAATLAQPLPHASRPEDIGISSQRLERVRQRMRADVESRRIPGAVLLIARNSKIASLDAFGLQDRRSQTPMKTDPIFRVASMSKPITSVAVMILAERSLAQPDAAMMPPGDPTEKPGFSRVGAACSPLPATMRASAR